MDERESILGTILVPLERLSQKPFSNVIAYPHADTDSVKTRFDQIAQLGIDQLVFKGSSVIHGVSVLGKGCVGIVVEGRTSKGESVALKIRRTDANRPDMHTEAMFQRLANVAGVGPMLSGEEPDVLAMELVTGQTLPRWLSKEIDPISTQPMLRSMLKQCCTLDQIGLDHGELSHAHKNILVSRKGPVIVDFESSSSTRNPHNVTSLVQYLFFSGKIAERVRSSTGFSDRAELIERLRAYKMKREWEQFENLMSAVKL